MSDEEHQQNGDESGVERSPQKGIVLFLGNIPWSSTVDDVKAAVKEAADMDVDAQISTRRDGRSRGYATIRVPDDQVKTLVDLSGEIVLGDREVTISRRKKSSRRPRRGRSNEGSNYENDESGVVLFLGNIPWDSTDDDVKAAVKDAVEFEVDAKVSTRKDGRSRGYATVRVTEDEAEVLIKMTGEITIGERPMNISRRKRKSRRTYRGRRSQDRGSGSGDDSGDAEGTDDGRMRRRNSQGNSDYSDENTPQKKDGKVLFFGNIPWESTAEDIQESIQNATGVETKVKVSMRGGGRSRGYATARCSIDEAKRLIDVSGELEVGDRKIRIEEKKRRPRGGRSQGRRKHQQQEIAEVSEGQE